MERFIFACNLSVQSILEGKVQQREHEEATVHIAFVVGKQRDTSGASLIFLFYFNLGPQFMGWWSPHADWVFLSPLNVSDIFTGFPKAVSPR